MNTNEKLVLTCEVCGSEMIALHGFFVICHNCPEQDESCQAGQKKNSEI